MPNSTKTGCLLIAGLSFGTARCAGIEPSDVLLFSKGPVTLRPQLSVSQVYNDNVYYRPDNTVDDFLTIVSPGFILGLGTQEANFVNLAYFYDRIFHLQETDQSANQHRIALNGKYQHNRLTLEGSDQIEFLSSVLGGGISLRGMKVDRTTYLDEYRLTLDTTDKTSVYVEATHSTFDYQDDLDLYDTTTWIGTGGFEFKAFERLFFFGELFYGQTSLDPNGALFEVPTASFIGGFAGARGFFTERLSGTVKAGYENREFSDDSEGSGLPVVEASISQKFTDNLTVTASYSRRQRVSVQFARSEYVANFFGLNASQVIGSTGRLRANFKGTYAMLDYDPSPSYAERFDQILRIGGEISYDFKIWLRGFLGYDYERLRSDLARIEDYDVNRVTLGIAVGY